MSTQAQVDANRANSRHSTGPRTEEGKAASSRNATTHGLFSASFAVPDADHEAFDELRASFYVEIEPIGILEQTEFDTLVEAAWKLQLIRRHEKQALERNEANPEQILDRFSPLHNPISAHLPPRDDRTPAPTDRTDHPRSRGKRA